MIGQVLAHYELIEKIGEGGMGLVYRARDTKLRRDVALKMLPPEVAGSSRRVQRLTQEARAVARLNHPNIVTLYSIEEFDGLHFLTMEHVRGNALSEVISSDGIAIGRLLELACPLAEALAAAHAVGVVHRDLKPANVVLGEDGRPRILDFGLATLLGTGNATETGEGTTVTMLTQEGVVMGTVPYMSPEQLQGQAVDARSDVYSFGVMLFEMATGRKPFTASSQAGLVSSILKDPAPSITDLRADQPPSLQRVIARCLEKDPLRRYQTSQDVFNELGALRAEASPSSNLNVMERRPTLQAVFLRSPRWRLAAGLALSVLAIVGTWQARSSRPSSSVQAAVAVLPFTNKSADPEAEYLCDGVTESLISRLSQVSNLKVMSHHTISRFKGEQLDARAIGRQLGVTSVLMGHVDWRGSKLIVGVELLDVEDGSQLWGDRFERNLADILVIERDIATRIGEKLRVRLSGDEAARLSHVEPVNPEAYSLYLKGRYFLIGTGVDGPARAQEFFRQALEIEPQFALAYAGLGDAYVAQAWLSSRARDEMLPKAKKALANAMEFDGNLSEAHILDGQVKMYFDWDWTGAEAAFRRAIELKPGSDLAHRAYASFLCNMNRMDEAIDESRHAQVLDPLSVHATHTHAFNLMCAGQLEEAAAEFQKAIELNPNWIWGNVKLGMTYALMEDHAQAEAAKSRADELLGGRPGSQLAQSWLAAIERRAGKLERTRVTLARLLEESRESYVDPAVLASLYYGLGEYEKTVEMLVRGYEIRSPMMVYLLLQGKVFFQDISTDARFQDLLKRMDFPLDPS